MNIAPFKSRPAFSNANDLSKYPTRPVMGQACRRCFTLIVRDKITQNNAPANLTLVNILHPPALKDFSIYAWLAPDFYYSFISSTTFRHRYHNIRERIIKSERVKEGVQKATTQDISLFEDQDFEAVAKKHGDRAASVFAQMSAHINRFIINITGWVLLKLLRRLFRTVQVQAGQMKQIQKASKDNLPIVFLPNHRSHLDYILLTFALWQWDIRAPHVAAGDNLDIPVFSYILRSLGAFFIKRRLDDANGRKDYVYRSVLHSYMTELLKCGEYVEFFIEAGRSRTGKLVLPKSGLLAVVVETFLEEDITNCYIVPVSISYEKIIDAHFLLELSGEEKIPETFWGTVKGMWSAFRLQFGSVRIDFAQPILLKDMLEGLNRQLKASLIDVQGSSLQPMPLQVIPCRSSLSSLCGSDISPGVSEDTRHLIKDLCYHVAWDFTENTPHMCTHLLSFLLITKYPNGGRFQDVVDDFHWLACQVIKRRRDIGFSGDANDVVRYALNLLGPELVSIEVSDDDSGVGMRNSQEDVNFLFITPAVKLPEVLHLAYYKNSVVSVFLLESIVANAVLCLCPKDALNVPKTIRLFENDIFDKSFALCDLLRLEFLFCRPCVSLKQALTNAINSMIDDGLLKWIFSVKRASEVFWDSSDSNEDLPEKCNENTFYVPQNNVEKCLEDHQTSPKNERQLELVLTSEINSELFKFFVNILKPFLHSYLFAVKSLNVLNELEMNEHRFVKHLLSTAKEIIKDSSKVISVEFASMENFRNATKWLLQKRIIKSFKINNSETIRLMEPYQSNEEHLKSFQNSIESLCTIICHS